MYFTALYLSVLYCTVHYLIQGGGLSHLLLTHRHPLNPHLGEFLQQGGLPLTLGKCLDTILLLLYLREEEEEEKEEEEDVVEEEVEEVKSRTFISTLLHFQTAVVENGFLPVDCGKEYIFQSYSI